jgi:ubiquinone/menaquinone biosynthesis C-methylase UbiE
MSARPGDDLKAKVQTQFGASASQYAQSAVHAGGGSLALLLELAAPRPAWRVLDVATGAGHTALLFAPHVAQVVAVDLTPAMLAQTEKLAQERGLDNIVTRLADAEALPFAEASFDLLTCRLALHHFPHPEQALAEFARVLKPGGRLAFSDNITVPDAPAAAYYNAYEKLRDPSHHWVYALAELERMFSAAGLVVEAVKQAAMKELEFHDWADRQHVPAADKEKLLEMMRRLPPALEPLFAPRWSAGTLYFSLWEAVIVAGKPLAG